MSKITVRDVHQDAALTNFAIGYHPGQFVAERIAPPVMVNKESDKYYIWDRQSAFQVGPDADGKRSLRPDKTESYEVDFGLSTSTYTAEEYALKILVSDREKKNADSVLKLRDSKRRRLQDLLMLEQELRVASLLTTSANWDTNHTDTPDNKWDVDAATIEDDIDTAKIAVRQAIGVEPNTIVIPDQVAKAVKKQQDIRELIKYTHSDLLVNGDLPPRLFNLDVIIPGATYTASGEGASSPTYSDVWGEAVVLLYVDPEPVIDSPTAVKIFRAENWNVDTWRVSEKKSEAIEVSVIQDEVLTSNISGYLYTNTLT